MLVQTLLVPGLVIMGPRRPGDSAKSKPRGKFNPGMVNGKGGPRPTNIQHTNLCSTVDTSQEDTTALKQKTIAMAIKLMKCEERNIFLGDLMGLRLGTREVEIFISKQEKSRREGESGGLGEYDSVSIMEKKKMKEVSLPVELQRYKEAKVFSRDASKVIKPGEIMGPVTVGLEENLLDVDEVAVLKRGPRFCCRRIICKERYLIEMEKCYCKIRWSERDKDPEESKERAAETAEERKERESRETGRGGSHQEPAGLRQGHHGSRLQEEACHLL